MTTLRERPELSSIVAARRPQVGYDARSWPVRWVFVFAAGLAGLALLAAGCTRSKTSVAKIGATSATTSSASSLPVVPGGSVAPDTGSNPAGGPAAVFVACLRRHGVPNMPSPGPGMKSMPAGVDPNSPQFQKAVRECVQLVPADAPPDLVAHPVGPLLAFAKCMRKHGVPSFPDPDSTGRFHESALARIDMTAPIFQRAQKTCLPLAKNEPIARVSP
jgi:hypothetical protein